MSTVTLRKALLGSVALLSLAACSDSPAPLAPAEPTYSPALLDRLASEQARIDSTARIANGPLAVTNDGLLGGLLGIVGGVVGGLTGTLTGVLNGLTYTVLSCQVQPYGATTRIIGPAGGTITVGRTSLVIPQGALSQYTVITAEVPRTNRAEVRFAPHGLQFAKPAALTMSYSHCQQESGYTRGIVYLNEAGEVAEAPLTVDIAATDRVLGTIGHFSGYVIAHTRTARSTSYSD